MGIDCPCKATVVKCLLLMLLMVCLCFFFLVFFRWSLQELCDGFDCRPLPQAPNITMTGLGRHVYRITRSCGKRRRKLVRTFASFLSFFYFSFVFSLYLSFLCFLHFFDNFVSFFPQKLQIRTAFSPRHCHQMLKTRTSSIVPLHTHPPPRPPP